MFLAYDECHRHCIKGLIPITSVFEIAFKWWKNGDFISMVVSECMQYIPYKNMHCFVVLCIVVLIEYVSTDSHKLLRHMVQGCLTGGRTFP